MSQIIIIILTIYFLFFIVAPSGYPRITESPTLKAVEKDRNTVMICSATGNPDPVITWLKDFIPVDLTDPRLKLLDTGKNIRTIKIKELFGRVNRSPKQKERVVPKMNFGPTKNCF